MTGDGRGTDPRDGGSVYFPVTGGSIQPGPPPPDRSDEVRASPTLDAFLRIGSQVSFPPPMLARLLAAQFPPAPPPSRYERLRRRVAGEFWSRVDDWRRKHWPPFDCGCDW